MLHAWPLALVVLILLLLPRADAAARGAPAPVDRPMRVAFLDTLLATNPLRRNVMGAMRAAANDLGIELSIHLVSHWPGEILEQARAVMTGPGRPDYLLLSVHRGIGPRLLELAQELRVPVFVINSGLLPEDVSRLGGPRGHFPLWLGQMLPDDVHAGAVLARLLLRPPPGAALPALR